MKPPIKRRSTDIAAYAGMACLALMGVFVVFCTIWERDHPRVDESVFAPIPDKTTEAVAALGNVEEIGELPEMTDSELAAVLERIDAIAAGEDISPSVESGKTVYGALPSRDAWAYEFAKNRKVKLQRFPICEGCGCPPEECGPMNSHHAQSVLIIITKKLSHDLLTSVDNMVILCRKCHKELGHPTGWKDSNPHVRRDAAKRFASIWPGTTYAKKAEEYLQTQLLGRYNKLKRVMRQPAKTTVAP